MLAFVGSVEALSIEYPFLLSSKSAVVKITLPSALIWSILRSEFLPAILTFKSSLDWFCSVVAVIAPSTFTFIDFVKSRDLGPTPI